MRRKKNKSIFLFMFLCILIMGVGYAFLTSTLTINGVGAFSKNSWLIYFNDIREKAGSAEATTPAWITNPEATHIEFDVDLDKPGDFYDFDVYIKNDGTIDAMIDEVTITGLSEEQKKYMNFIYTYTDGTKIRKCDVLPAQSFRDTHLRVEYSEDADLEAVPENGTTHLDVSITYVQSSTCTPDPEDEETITVTVDPDGGIYDGTTELTTVELSNGNTYTLLTPTRDNYTFTGWVEVTNTNSYLNNVVTANGQDVRVKATWESNIPDVNTIILTIDPNGGTYNEATTPSTVELEEGNTYTLLTATKEGYTLTGWEEVTETNSLSNGVVTAGTKNVRVKAIWEENAPVVNTITLTINPDGGTYSGETSVELEEGEVYTVKEVTKEGFNLVRWEETTNTNSLSNGVVTAGTEDVTIKAIWEEVVPATITLTINPNGGTYAGDTTVEITEGESYTLLGVTREGYSFEGWEETTNTNSLSNGIVTAGTENVTVKANWTEIIPNTVTLIIDPDGGTYSGETTVTLEEGEVYTIKSVTKEGFTLVRWEETSSTNTLTGSIITAGTEDVTIKAIWEANTPVINTINLTIDPNGGIYNESTSTTTVEVEEGKTYTLLTPTREGYNFVQWVETTTTNSLSNGVVTAGENDVDVVAQWEQLPPEPVMYTITIDPDGGVYNMKTTPTVLELSDGATYNVQTVTREGYTFKGWTETTETNSYSDGVITVDGHDVTIKATWEEDIPETVTLTINTDGGTYDGETIVTLEVGEVYTIKEVTKEGFELVEWQEVTQTNSLTGTIVTAGSEDIEIKAIWQEIVPENDRVAKIIRNEEDKFYTSIQNAINDASDGETIYLLKNTSEEFTNDKNVTLDLGGFKVTGSGTNEENHYLTIINGSIENEDGVGFTNNGTLTLGINDDQLCPLYVENPNCGYENGFASILGTTKGIEQNGVFNFYDGFVEGGIAISGDVSATPVYEVIQENPTYYFVFVNHDAIRDDQKAYLAISSGDAVSMTTQGGLFYYVDLSDNFRSSANDGKKIYIIRDFEGAYSLDVPQGVTINLDLAGWDASIGNNINNKGTLNIMDDGVTKGSLNLAHPIMQEGTLNITNATLNATSQNESLIISKNTSTINITNSHLTSLDGQVIENEGTTVVTADENTIFEGNNTLIYSTNDLTMNGGTYLGANVDYGVIVYLEQEGKFKLKDATINLSDDYWETKAIYTNSEDVSIELENNTISTRGPAIYCDARADVLIKSGSITSKDTVISNCNTTMNGGTVTGSAATIYGGSLTLNAGTVTVDRLDGCYYCGGNAVYFTNLTMTGGTINDNSEESNSSGVNLSTFNISGGTINSKHAAISDLYDPSTISRGNINGEIYGIHTGNGDSLNITGGTITGGVYGIYNESNAAIDLGIDDGTISTTSPTVIGDTYGIYIESGTVNFYDGVLKGKTAGKEGTINAMPDGTILNESDTEEIPNSEDVLHLAYLQENEKFLRVGENEYNSLNSIFTNESSDTLTIEVIKDGAFYSTQTIPEGKTVTLNLNQHMISNSQEIVNEGTLTINDTKKEVSGELTYVGGINPLTDYTITNSGTLTINGGKYISSLDRGVSLFFLAGGSIEINDGLFIKDSERNTDSSLFYAENYDGLDMIINGGKFESEYDTTINCYYPAEITITGGTFNTNRFIYNGHTSFEDGTVNVVDYAFYGGTLELSGGTITRNNSYNLEASLMNMLNVIEITGGTINDTNECSYCSTVYMSNLTMSDGVINTNIRGIYDSDFTITGGTITSTNTAIVANGHETQVITGGTITGGDYGIELGSGSLVIGTKDETISNSSPVIKGDIYGLTMYDIEIWGTIQYKEFRFYDGILKGKTKGLDSFVYETPDGYTINENGTEEINGETYKTAVLAPNDNFMQVGEHTYNSFTTLFEEEQATNITIDLIGNGSLFYDTTIPEDRNVTINLNGYTITTSQPIINNSPLTINDTAEIVAGEKVFHGTILTNAGTELFEVQNTLNINGGKFTINQKNVTLLFVMKPNSILNITDGEFTISDITTSTSAIFYLEEWGEEATINISGGYFNNHGGSHIARKSNGTLNVNISDGTFESYTDLFSDVNTVMTGGTITANRFAFAYGTLDLRGGTIIGNKYNPEGSSNDRELILGAEVTMSGGTIDARTYAISNSDITLTNGTITCLGTCIQYSSMDMSGGTITSEDIAIGNNYDTEITGGIITGGTYGIYQTQNETTLGSNDGTVSKTIPVIKGGTYGYYKTNGTFNFYDGIIKGGSGAIDGIVEAIAPGTYIFTGSENIIEDGDTVTYVTNYLEDEFEFITNKTQSKNYSNINTAIDEANDNDKFELFESASTYDEIIIDKDIEIDMKGKSLLLVNGISIDEDKEVTIKNTSSDASKISTLTNNELITNYGQLTINNVDIENTNNKVYVLRNYNELTLNSLDVTSKQAIYNEEDATLTLTDTNISADYEFIYNKGTISITRGTFTDTDAEYSLNYLVVNDENTTATITGVTSGVGLFNDNYSTMNVSNSNINGKIYNKNEITFDNVDITRSSVSGVTIYNSGTFDYVKGTIDIEDAQECFGCYSATIMNEGTMVLDQLSMNFDNNRYDSNSNIYENSYTPLTIKNSTITVRDTNIRYENVVTVEDGELLVQNTTFSVKNTYDYEDEQPETASIYSRGGSTVIQESTIDTEGYRSFGIYLDGGDVLVEIGNTITSTGDYAYGVYVNDSSAKVTFGETEEGVNPSEADVDQTSPLVSGIGNEEGYGIYRKNGEYNYYDGKFVGSTHARYGAATDWETHWEARVYLNVGEPEYCVLEYMTGQ